MSDEHSLLKDKLPRRRIEDAIPHLTRPFAPEAVKFKVQVGKEGATTAMIVAHLDARLVIARLNAVHPWWDAEYRVLDSKGQVQECRLQLGGTHRSDVGEGGDWKSARSDSLKRAAVHYGVGVSLYATKQVWLKVGPEDHELRKDWKDRPIVDDRTEAYLRRGYARWVTMDQVATLFGPVLAHGEVAEAPGPEPESAPEGLEPQRPDWKTPPLKVPTGHTLLIDGNGEYTEQAQALLREAQSAHDELRKLRPKDNPPRQHHVRIQNLGSVEELGDYIRELNHKLQEAS